MSNWYGDYWASFKDAVALAWPEIAPGNLFQDTRLERADWINDLNGNEIKSAWAVVKVDITDADEWGTDWPCFSVAATVHYILPLSGVPEGQTATEYLTGKQIDLYQTMFRAGGIGTVMTSAPLSMNADDDLTMVLLEAKLPYQAAGVQITSIVMDIQPPPVVVEPGD